MSVTFSGVVLSTEVNITPFLRVPGGFTSRAESLGYSLPITVTFLKPVKLFRVTTNQITNAGARVELYNDKNELLDAQNAPLKGNGEPQANNWTYQVTSKDFPDIKWAKLIPPPNDYVDYQGFIIKVVDPDPETPVPLDPSPTPSVTPSKTPPISQTPKPTPTTTPSPTPRPKTIFKFPVVVTIAPALPPVVFSNTIVVDIAPEQTPSQELILKYPVDITLLPIPINLSIPIIELSRAFIRNALDVYVDEDRDLKTLLNYGEDQQSVVLSWREGFSPRSMQLKLLQPVPDDIDIDTPVFLSREVAKSLIDKVRIRFAPPINATPYLRPKNTDVEVNPRLGKTLRNITLRRLQLESGSLGAEDLAKNISFEDQIFRQWYSYDFNSSELNLDFTNYDNFIFYSSAYLRLLAFREKLKQIEKLDAERVQFISGSVFTGSLAFAGATYIQEQTALLSKQKEDIIRAFDRYEQHLYFMPSGSNSPYTASFDYADEGYEYNTISYWPKSGSALWPVSSTTAEEWFTTQSAIAQRFDEFNENNLVNTIPTHVREHEDNAPYITFVSMIGHFFDTIKPYIDQFPEINSRFLNPNEELSKDLVNEIAESLGFELPTVNSLYNLSDLILGTNEDAPRRDYTIETYKRLLHNLPLFAKAKGSRTSFEALLRSLGISPQFLSIRETGTPTTSSYNVFDEYTTVLDFDSSTFSAIEIPLSASLRSPRSLQLNVSLPISRNMTLVTGDQQWALRVTPSTTLEGYGTFELVSGFTNSTIVSSSYYPIFDNEPISVALQVGTSTAEMVLMKVDGEDVIFSSKVSIPFEFVTFWNTTNYAYIGGSGSLRIGGFEGTVNEVRLWNTELTDSAISASAFDPGIIAGNNYTASIEELLVQLSFDNVDTNWLNASSSLLNESTYLFKENDPSLEYINVLNINSGSLTRYARTVKQDVPVIGAAGYTTSKVKVLPPPVFVNNNVTSDGVKKLSRTKSIVRPDEKRLVSGKNRILLSLSPTEIINQNIIRSIGLQSINDIFGLPPFLFKNKSNELRNIRNFYNQYYYVDVNANRYIRIVQDIGSVLNQVIEYFIPSKAQMFKGIIIEPNVLEKNRIPITKEIKFYGSKARKTLNAPGSLTGSRADYGATFNLSQEIAAVNTATTVGTSAYLQSKIEDIKDIVAIGSTETVNSKIDMNQTETIISNIQTQTGKIEQIDTAVQAQYTTQTTTVETNLPDKVEAVSKTLDTLIDRIETIVTSSYLAKQGIVDIEIPRDVIGNVNSYSSGSFIKENSEKIISSSFVTYLYQHESWEEYRFAVTSGSFKPQKISRIDMSLDIGNKIGYYASNKGKPGAEPYNRLYPRKLFDEEINFPRNGGITSLNTNALYEIKPSTDFTDPGVTTFFNNPDGLYFFPIIEKSPVYPKPINFETATTWSYGARYNIYDVVYQEVTSADEENLKDLVYSSRGGNGRYYVFTTRPAYRPPSDGTAYYSGNVPSYIPPSLDANNWTLLKFRPIERRIPRRIVYDTFRVSLPELNNYKTTTIDFRRVIDIPDRYVDSSILPSIGSGSHVTGEITAQNMLALFGLQTTNANIRVRFYRTTAARDADIARSSTTLPTGSHGVLLDVTLNDVDVLQLTNPIPILVADSSPPAGRLFYTINNLTSTPKESILLFTYYYALQIEPRIPRGYLRGKHYRFFRDNSTATKRRTYLGCKNTQETTIDGLPPVQIFLSEGNDLTVSPTKTNTEITTGGGGTLDVT